MRWAWPGSEARIGGRIITGGAAQRDRVIVHDHYQARRGPAVAVLTPESGHWVAGAYFLSGRNHLEHEEPFPRARPIGW